MLICIIDFYLHTNYMWYDIHYDSVLNTAIIHCIHSYVHIWIFLCTGERCTNDIVQDVIFVIDTSGSIGASNFPLIINFVANITVQLAQASPRSAVGVILFNTNARIAFNLQAYTTLSGLLSAINQLPYSGGGTNTAEALGLLLLSAQNGALGLRNNSSKVAIVVTDGQSNDQSATLSKADSLHASNIFDVFSVGVAGASLTEIQAIASSPEYVHYTNILSSAGLQNVMDGILPELCVCK